MSSMMLTLLAESMDIGESRAAVCSGVSVPSLQTGSWSPSWLHGARAMPGVLLSLVLPGRLWELAQEASQGQLMSTDQVAL